MVNDSLSDFVSRIKNGYMAHRKSIEVPATKAVENLVNVLVKEKYVESVENKEGVLTIKLKYSGKEPAVMGIIRVSSPGSRTYTGVSDIKRVWGGLGMNILSTPKGIISDKEARKLHVGGEVICQIW